MIKNLHFTRSLATLALVIFMLTPGWGWGQTNPTPQSLPYSQNFGTTTFTSMPTGMAGWNGLSGASVTTQALAEASTPSGNATIAAATTAQPGGGIWGFASSSNGRAYIQTSSNASNGVNQVALAVNTTGKNSIIISYDVEIISAQPRTVGIVMQYRIGTSGSWTTVSGTGNPYSQAGGTTGIKASPNLNLPSACDNQSVVQIRWATWRGTEGGNSSGIAIDNISVSGTDIPVASAISDIIGADNETSNIAYASYQASSITATADAIRLFSFTIRDGGGSADGDALPTILSSITLNKGAGNTVTNWAGTIKQAALYDGSTEVAEISVTGETIAFTGLSGSNVTAGDGSTKTLDLYVTFESSVTDNQQVQFQITNANVAAAASGSSTFSAFTAVLSNVSGDANKIEVTATDILFDQNVSSVGLGAVMSPSPTLRAIDANVNYDLDYTEGWSVGVTTGTVSFDPSATTTGSFSSSLVTLSNLKFNSAGTANKITVTSGSFTDESGAFDVTNPLPEINIKQASTNYLSASTYAFGNQLSGTSSSTITFTIENLGTAILNLTGTPKIALSGTNASEFTIDETATSAAVAVSGSTTFTITFSPTSQGAKTAAISIANDDATGSENPYVINLTGTGTVSAASDIANTSGYTYTSNVAYESYQLASSLTTGNSVGVNGLTIRDGSGSADADNLSTTLTAISFTTGGSTAIRTAALFDGTNNVGEVAVNGATTIAFSGLSLIAADNGTKDFELRVTYQGTVTDNQQIAFTVSSATASATGSGFAVANAGSASSSTSGDINRIEVTATVLVFGIQPGNVTINSVMSPAPSVIARDGNNNTDLDFIGSVTLSSTGTIAGGATNPVSAIGGTATFNNLQFSVVGTGITIAGSSGSLTATGNSNTFNVSVQEAGLLLFEENFNYTSGTNLTANGWSAHSSSGTNPVKVNSGGLSYSNYGSTAIGNAAVINSSGEDDSRTFTQQNSGTTTYYAFLVNVSSATSGGDYIVHLGPSSISTEFRCRFYTKYTGGNLTFGVSTNGTTINYISTNYAYGTTYLVVMKHFFNGTTQTSSLFINPSVTSEPATADISETSSTSLSTNIGSVAIRQSSSSNIAIIDGIRIGTNWGAVLGNPQYSATSTINSGNYNNVSVLPGGNLIIESGKGITVNGTLTNNAGNAGLVIESGGSLIENNGVAATVKRDISNSTWHLISVPNHNTKASTFMDDYLQTWSESTPGWTDITEPETSLLPGIGYGLWSVSGTTESVFSGALNTGTYTIPVTKSGASASNNGANLLGNPYPCFINWADLDNTWSAVYYWNGSAYVSWNNNIGAGSQYIPPMQGFFIIAPSSGNFVLANTNKAHSVPNYYKSASALSSNTLVLATMGESYSDKLFINFNPEASNDYDLLYDAYKILAYTPGQSELYSYNGDKKMSIDVRPEREVIQLGFRNDQSGTYQIGMSDFADINVAYIEDTKTKTYHDLFTGPYSFDYTAGESEQRLLLHFGTTSVPDDQSILNTNIYSYQQTVYVNFNENINGNIYIYNLAGQLVTAKESASGSVRIGLSSTGVYMVKVVTQKETLTQKVVIR
jgi:hypothetical protein